MTAPALSAGAIRQMIALQDKPAPGTLTPVLQVINVKPVPGGRFRAILSDGSHFVTGMLASQTIASTEVQQDCIIRVDDFMTNVVQGRMVIILLGMTVLVEHYPNGRIGNPVSVENEGVAAAAAAPPSAAAAADQQPLYNSTNNTTGNPFGGGAGGEYKSNGSSNPTGNSNSNTNPYGGGAVGGGGSNPYGGNRAANQQPHVPIQRVQPNNMPNAGITAIAALNMYNNRWTIQARLTVKSDIRTWSNSKGEGSLFSVELLDSSQDIRATFFKEAVDKFYHMLEVGKVYTFAGGRLKVANMQYNTCKSNFEITFDQNAEIHLANDDGNIEKQTYDLKKIATIEQIDANSNVDILAVVKAVGEPANLISKKSGQELTKCDLTLVDDTGVEINLTVWGDKAKTAPADFAGQPVAAFRRARVSDYGGKSLSAGPSCEVNPDHLPEAQQLRAWWQSTGSLQATTARSLSSTMGGGAGQMDPLSNRKTIQAIKQENLGHNGDKPDWISFKGTLSFVRKDKEGGAWYPACANAGEPCKNRFKVTQTTDGQWFCDKCQGTYPNPVRRWIFSGVVEDATSSTWVSFFNEQAETLFGGLTADECYNEAFAGGGGQVDQDRYDSVFAKILFSEWIFKCKVKNEIHNEESRVKTSVYSLHPMDYAKESLDLLAAIEQF